jgi:hypothetical protein
MEDYLKLLLKQLEKNQQINDFAKRERDAIAEGDIGVVMESDAHRREIIGQLRALQVEMDPYIQRLSQDSGQLPVQLKEQIIAVSKQLQEMIKETMTIDRENEINLRKLREGLGERIEEIGRGKKALNGYKNTPQKTPKLFHGAV